MSNPLIIEKSPTVHRFDYFPMRLLHFNSQPLKHWAIRNYRSTFWRLYCNLDPGAEVRLGRKKFPLKARHVYLLPAWIQWDGDAPAGTRHIYAHFDLPGLTARFCRDLFPVPICVYHPRNKNKGGSLNLAGELETLAAADNHSSMPDPVHICWVKSLVYWALREAFASLSPQARVRCTQMAAGRHPLNHVLAYIENNPAEDLSNAKLAEVVPCSESHLIRLFRKHLGVAPAAYVTERRISMASNMLFHGQASIDQIALLCGFPNRNYFSRVFAREIGVPPARYRKLGMIVDG